MFDKISKKGYQFICLVLFLTNVITLTVATETISTYRELLSFIIDSPAEQEQISVTNFYIENAIFAPIEKETPPLVVEEPQVEVDKTMPTSIPARYRSSSFTKSFERTRDWREIRQDTFEVQFCEIPIQTHQGGEKLNEEELRETISSVILLMPNLKHTPEFEELLFETIQAETDTGRIRLSTNASSRNYGVAQLREDTVKDTLWWLQQIRPDVYDYVMSLYDSDKDMRYNITYNVPFSIAMMAQYYWRKVPDLYANISTLEERAEMWKAAYNSHLGAGTVYFYLKRATETA